MTAEGRSLIFKEVASMFYLLPFQHQKCSLFQDLSYHNHANRGNLGQLQSKGHTTLITDACFSKVVFLHLFSFEVLYKTICSIFKYYDWCSHFHKHIRHLLSQLVRVPFHFIRDCPHTMNETIYMQVTRCFPVTFLKAGYAYLPLALSFTGMCFLANPTG